VFKGLPEIYEETEGGELTRERKGRNRRNRRNREERKNQRVER